MRIFDVAVEVLLSCLISIQIVHAQQPPFVIRVRKDTLPAERSVSAPTAKASTQSIDNNVLKTYPRIMGGDFAVMRVQKYDESRHKSSLDASHYVIFAMTINPNGFAQDILIQNTNSQKLANVLYKNIRQARWHPATNQAGEPMAYRYPLQICSFPKNYDLHETIEPHD